MHAVHVRPVVCDGRHFILRGKHLHDRIIALREKVWDH